jgi:microcompartment protein CcmL/EutN
MEFNSIAMIETNGLVSAIVALETMLKLGEIKFLNREIISNGQVTIFVSGNAPNLKRALQASEIAANNVGTVISSSLIENPTKGIMDLIAEEKQNNSKTRKSKKKSELVKNEKVDTLFDDLIEDAIVEESSKVNYENEIIIEEDKIEIADQKSEDADSEKSVSEKNIIDSSELNNTENLPEDVPTETENVFVEEKKEEMAESIDLENNEELNLKDDLDSNNNNKIDNLSHLDRLRVEAKLEIEKEIKLEKEFEAKDVKPIVKNEENEYSKMNVHELRKLARSNPNFPIKGREISKANRKVLIDYLNNI